MNKQPNIEEVKKAIRDIVWMARRYADGRRTYAPSMFNDAYNALVRELGNFERENDPDNAPDRIKNYPYASDDLRYAVNDPYPEELKRPDLTSGCVFGTLHENGDGSPWIMCLDCQRKSYHPEDIKQRYCGNCHKFHPPVNGEI